MLSPLPLSAALLADGLPLLPLPCHYAIAIAMPPRYFAAFAIIIFAIAFAIFRRHYCHCLMMFSRCRLPAIFCHADTLRFRLRRLSILPLMRH